MQKKVPRKRRLKSELEIIKRIPGNPLNLNGRIFLDNKEKAVLVVTSKPFVVVASILTFGIYYLYYNFCVYSSKESPFDLLEKGKKYDYVRLEEIPDEVNNAKRISDGIVDLINEKKDKRKEFFRSLWIKKKSVFNKFWCCIYRYYIDHRKHSL